MQLLLKTRDAMSAWYLQRFLRRVEPDFEFSQRRLYVRPLWPGLGLFAGFLIMLFASINYGMNTGFMFSFMVLAYGIVAALMTNLNIYRLRLRAPLNNPAVFCGEPAAVNVTLTSVRNTQRYAIGLGPTDRFKMSGTRYLNLPSRGTGTATLELPTSKRGRMVCPLIRVETNYPFGLFQVWGFWNPGVTVLVYPTPESGAPPLFTNGEQPNHLQGSACASSQDVAGVRAYRPGDSRKRLAWRQIAKTDGFSTGQLYTKDHEGSSTIQMHFDYDDLPASLSTEQRLSRLTAWSLAANAAGVSYCVNLPGATSGMDTGAPHLEKCLCMLALFNLGEGEE